MSQGRVVPGPLICPDCGRSVGPQHFPLVGRPRCQRGNVFWTPPRLWRLTELTERGWDDDRIAAALTRECGRPVSRSGIRIARWRHHQPGPWGVALSSNEVARRLGLSGGELVVRWITNGWLAARRGIRVGRGRAWLIEQEALWDFLDEPMHWHRWSPEAIVDPALRRYVASHHGEASHVPIREAVPILERRGIYVSRGTVENWIRAGLLPVVQPAVRSSVAGGRRSLLMVPVAALAIVEPPRVGGRRREVSQ